MRSAEGSVEDLLQQNINKECQIKYRKNNKYETVVISNDLKNKTIKELVLENTEIISIVDSKPTLEEIIYNVK